MNSEVITWEKASSPAVATCMLDAESHNKRPELRNKPLSDHGLKCCTFIQHSFSKQSGCKKPPQVPDCFKQVFVSVQLKVQVSTFIFLNLLHQNHIELLAFTGNSLLNHLFIIITLGKVCILSESLAIEFSFKEVIIAARGLNYNQFVIWKETIF